MLFNLGQMNLLGKSRKEVRTILGASDAQPKQLSRTEDMSDLYDLGDCEGNPVLLQAEYYQGALRSLRLLIKTNDRATASDFGWITRNESGDQAAEKFNETFFLVGTSVQQLTNILGRYPQRLIGSRDHLIGQLQVRYSRDNTKVTKFRLYYRPAQGKKLVPSRWQRKNLNVDAIAYTNLGQMFNRWNGTGIDKEFLIPDCSFTTKNWQASKLSRYRSLFDLCHTFRLIGMSRADIHQLLGLPSYPTKDGKVAPMPYESSDSDLNPAEKKCEWYCVWSPIICGNPASKFLQLQYENDRVTRYRLEERGGGGTSGNPYIVACSITANEPRESRYSYVESEVLGVADELPPMPDDSSILSILDERYMRKGRSERTLALPGTLPKDAPIQDIK